MKVGFKLMQSKKEHSSLNSLGFKFTDGTEYITAGTICLAFWHYFYRSLGLKEIYLATTQAHNNHDIDINVFNKYIKYIMNNSKYSHAINTKRVCDAHRYGISFNVDAPYSHVQSAIIAIRRGWEFPEQLEVWGKLVDKGVHPSFAMILSIFVYKYGDVYRINPNGVYKNHEVFHINSFNKAIGWLKSPLSNAFTGTYRQKAFYCFKVFETNQSLGEYLQDLPFVRDEEASKEYSNRWDRVDIVDWDASILKILELQEKLDAKSFY